MVGIGLVESGGGLTRGRGVGCARAEWDAFLAGAEDGEFDFTK